MLHLSRALWAFLVAALVAIFIPAVAGAEVDPASVEAELYSGDSIVVDKTVTIPETPANVEVCLVADVSGSFVDDLVQLNAQSSAITAIVASADTASFGLATFQDYPVNPFGNPPFGTFEGDSPYTLVTPLTDEASWQTAVAGLVAQGGNDFPESQLDAIYGAVNGLADPTGLNSGAPWGPGCGFTGGLGTTQILIATTDAECHEPTSGAPHQHSTADVVATLTANEIVFIGLDASGGVSCFGAIAAGTGGVVEPLAGDGSNITAAIEAALVEVVYDITPEPDAATCADVELGYAPAGYTGVSGGDVITFTETITYTGSGTDVITCTVGFGPAGVQTITITPIVEVLGNQGCSPGYWGNSPNADWGDVDPNASFLDVFGVGPDEALSTVITTGGGQFTALNRHAVAAYVNARSEGVEYPQFSSDVVALVADAYASGDWQTAKNILEAANVAGCPL